MRNIFRRNNRHSTKSTFLKAVLACSLLTQIGISNASSNNTFMNIALEVDTQLKNGIFVKRADGGLLGPDTGCSDGRRDRLFLQRTEIDKHLYEQTLSLLMAAQFSGTPVKFIIPGCEETAIGKYPYISKVIFVDTI